MSIDEGYIKYQSFWKKAVLKGFDIEAMNNQRSILIENNMIGHIESLNIGFGNISQRTKNNQFLISGTQTGHIQTLELKHYAEVYDYSIEQNEVYCKGEINASSESLSHAAIYECEPTIQAIIHIHHKPLWENLLNKVPTTDESIPYGTPEMANAIKNAYHNEGFKNLRILLMAGHEDGIISFGKDFNEAWEAIKDQL